MKVDGKVRTDVNFPAGFMDVITIEKTDENFRLIYDVKGRFAIHRITPEEARYKLCRVVRTGVAQKVSAIFIASPKLTLFKALVR